jgi:flagellar assembly protein FliH
MSQTVKFLFDESFAADKAGAFGQGAGGPDLFSPSQMAKAVADARAETAAAVENAVAGRAARALEAIAGQLREIAAAHADVVRQSREDALRLALAVAGKLAPALIRRQPAAEVEGAIAACLAQIQDEPRVVVRAAKPVVEVLKKSIDATAAAQGYAGRIVLLAEDGLSDADCRIEWAAGGAERMSEDIGARIAAAVERYLAAEPAAGTDGGKAAPVEEPA